MKHTLLAALTLALTLALAAAPTVSAQSATTTARDDHHTATAQPAHADSGAHARMMAALNLTDAQRTQIAAIHARYEGQMKGMSGMSGMSGAGNMSGMSSMPGMDKMMAQEMAEVRAVLTPEQQKRFDTMMADHQKNHHAHADHSGMQM